MTDEIEDRLDELESRIESVAETQKAVRESSIKPRIENLQSESDDAREERAELQEQIQDLEATVAQLQTTLEAVAGLADDQASNPEKRAADLRHTLIRRARDRDGEARMYWKEVQEALETLGHGKQKPPVCYKAMNDAANHEGFELGKKTSRDGNRVKAITVNLDALTADAVVKNPKTRTPPEGVEIPAQEVVKGTSD